MKHIDWVWMTHPTRNTGNPIPVQVFEDGGVMFYRPFDEDATEFELAEIDGDWAGAFPPQRQPLTDEQIELLLPRPDGSAESDVRKVEVLPGVFGRDFREIDAWSKALVLQFGRDLLAAHGITGEPQ